MPRYFVITAISLILLTAGPCFPVRAVLQPHADRAQLPVLAAHHHIPLLRHIRIQLLLQHDLHVQVRKKRRKKPLRWLKVLFHCRYCRMLEENSFRGRTSDFVMMFIFGSVCMILCAFLVNLLFLGKYYCRIYNSLVHTVLNISTSLAFQ